MFKSSKSQFVKDLKSAFEKKFFKARKYFSKILISIIIVKIKFTIRTRKYTIDLATLYTTRSILRPMVF